MTHPAVGFVLSAIKDNWSAGAYSDIPLERVDRNNNDLLDDNVRDLTPELKQDNYVSAAYTERDDSPIGTEYDLAVDGLVVNCQVVGLHHSEFGYINPDNSLPPTTAGDPVPFYDLHREIRDAILAEKQFPDTSSDIDYTDLVITNQTPLSYEYGDLYRFDFDVSFAGYEEL